MERDSFSYTGPCTTVKCCRSSRACLSLLPSSAKPRRILSSLHRTFKTPLGQFSFVRVPADNPRAGVRSVRIDRDAWVIIAGPVRAIADLIYTRKDVRWEVDGLAFLTESMRIDEEDLYDIPMDDVDEAIVSIRSRRVGRYLAGLRKEIEA